MRALFIALTLLFTSTSAMAQDWVVRHPASKLGFIATQVGAEFEGYFNKFDGSISFDPQALDASGVAITIEIASVDTSNAERDTNIVTPDWFHAEKYPTARFETTAIAAQPDGSYLAEATLQMRDVTKTVTLPFNVVIEGGVAKAKGRLSVSRTEFGIGQGQWAADTVVGDEVVIFFDLVADAK